jgi:hypothetical protein
MSVFSGAWAQSPGWLIEGGVTEISSGLWAGQSIQKTRNPGIATLSLGMLF